MSKLSIKTIDWTIDHLAQHNDTDIFPKAFEYEAIHFSKEGLVKKLKNQDVCQWTTRPLRKCLIPKNKFGFRIATQLDPLDMIFYMGLIIEVGPKIEKTRIPKEDNVSFSYRFKLDGDHKRIFDSELNYQKFDELSKELTKQYKYVVSADISDFYHRIYFHRLENALKDAIPTLPSHVTAICKLIKGWNQNVSYGIPVGDNPSRLLAELVIDDIDRTLLSEQIVFCRYVDDYRIFCGSYQEAYKQLSTLANYLYNAHGLTLNTQKTKIRASEIFMYEVLETEKRKALNSLANNFTKIISKLGIYDPYYLLEYGDLPEDVKSNIAGLNFEILLNELFNDLENADLSMIRFIINRLGWLKNDSSLDSILKRLDQLHPVFAEVIRYFARLTDVIPQSKRTKIGKFLLRKLENSVISQLDYHRMLIFSLFAGSNAWDNADNLPRYYSTAHDNWSRRSIILAVGKAKRDYWVRGKRSEYSQMSPWERRAFLYACTCLPKDEQKHYFLAIKSRLDELDRYVIDWASKNPIHTD